MTTATVCVCVCVCDHMMCCVLIILSRMCVRVLWWSGWGGHGRTGTVAAVLLAALLPVTTSVDDVFTIVQTLHATRVYNGAHLSPEIGQQPFVRRMIDLVRSLPPNYVPDPRYALASMPIVSTSTSPSADGDADAVTNSVMLSQPGHIRAGGGSGIIIIDEHGIASTTHATSMYPSTPLRRQVTRDPPLMPHDAPLMDGCTLLNREYLPIQPDVTPTVAASVSESSSSSSTASAPFTFTLLTMNTLAKSLCDSTSFPHSNPLALEWSHRAPGIVQELTGVHRPSQYTPDVICIQECDSIVYDEVMAPMLGGRGYSTSFYKKKMSDENKDGVAMFIRTCRMAVLSHRCIAIPTDKPSNQVLVITQLAPVLACYMHGLGRHQHHIDPVRRLYVCTSHLKAKEGHERLRLLQVHAIMSAIQQFINDVHTSSLSTPSVIDVSATKPVEYTATTDVAMTDADYNGSSASSSSSSANGSSSLNGVELPAGAAIMFAGDFNDTPSSDMYAYLASGSATLHADHASSSSHAATSTAPTTTSPEVIRHPFWLHSLYNRWWDYAVRHASNYTGDLYTTVKRRSILVQRCIDYIFYTPASLRPMYLLSIPPVPAEYLPAVNYPSDHFAISGVFQLH